MSSSRPGHCFQYVSSPTLTTPTFAVSGLRRATRGPSANAANATAHSAAHTTIRLVIIVFPLLA